ncbi:ParB/RepB/Spo0J family partition protein [Candidatus Woesearchaeota archaeon]|nr:ParB/RepB/Spo0J family partition protein [Candidatus Woesearchaeota archaeon]
MTTPKINIAKKRIGTRVLDINNVILLKNYRTNFSIKDIIPLAESMREVGQIQPVIVNLVDDRYELVAGQRRYYALTYAQLKKMKCVIYENLTLEEISKIQLSENIKQPISSIGKAESIPRAKNIVEKLEDRVISNYEFARMINRPSTNVNEAYHYQNLEQTVKQAVEKGTISYSIGVQIGRLEKPKQEEVFNKVLDGKEVKKSAKGVAKFVTDILKGGKEIPDTLELMLQEQDQDAYIIDKIKEYSGSLREAASYLRSLFILVEEKKQVKEIISKARLGKWVLGKVVESIAEYMDGFEDEIRTFNQEGLDEALHPKKKKHILDIILKERTLNTNGDSAHDLIKRAKEENISIDKIYRDKNQPRRTNTLEYREYIKNLSHNIKEIGVLAPILLVPRKAKQGYYRIVVGESRWRSSKKAGLKKIPSIPANLDDLSCYIIQIAEDLHRKDSPVERAQAITQLGEAKKKLGEYSKKDFAKEIEAFMGMKPAQVRKYLKFFELDKRTKQLVYNKTMSFTAALELYKIKDLKQRRDLCNIIIAENLRTQNVKKLVNNTLQTSQWYKDIQGKEKEFLEECEKSGREMVEAEIICNTIKSLEGLNSRLKSMPEEDKFYMDNRLAKSYVFFKHALEGYNQIMSK